MIILPWIRAQAWQVETPIDGRTYIIECQFNPANECWSMNLKDRNENLLVGSIKLIPNVALIGQFVDDRLPSGQLFITGSEMPTFESMGDSQQLVYFAAGELNAV